MSLDKKSRKKDVRNLVCSKEISPKSLKISDSSDIDYVTDDEMSVLDKVERSRRKKGLKN